jgi:precorrin-3B synthase
MTAPHRRGACPGLSAPMPTGDGLLVRLMPVDRVPLDSFIAFCAAARAHGNGTIEITARGSLQVRGLTLHSAPLFATEVAALGIDASDALPVLTDPLADDPDVLIDGAGLAREVRRAIAEARLALAPKVSVIIDGGGRLHLDALTADVRLLALPSAPAPRLHVAIGGDAASATPLGIIELEAAVGVVVRLLGVIAAHGRKARAVDVLRSDGIGTFPVAVDAAPGVPPRPRAEPIGKHAQRNGTAALGIALAFGHAHADALAELARLDAAHGIHAVRPTAGRALLLTGVTNEIVGTLAAATERLGFIVRADDPRRRIVACPGQPACASGLIASRALAAELAPHLPPSRDALAVHISGCAKGCAHPAAAPVTVVGTRRGCGIVANGATHDTPSHYVDPSNLIAEIAHEAVHG